MCGHCGTAGMSIILMVDEEYGVKLRSDDIRGAHTIEDIYNKVKALKDLTAYKFKALLWLYGTLH